MEWGGRAGWLFFGISHGGTGSKGGKGSVGSQTSLPCSGSSAGTEARCSCSLAGGDLRVISNARAPCRVWRCLHLGLYVLFKQQNLSRIEPLWAGHPLPAQTNASASPPVQPLSQPSQLGHHPSFLKGCAPWFLRLPLTLLSLKILYSHRQGPSEATGPCRPLPPFLPSG